MMDWGLIIHSPLSMPRRVIARRHQSPRWLTMLLLSLTLMARIIVPSGFMVAPAMAGAGPMIVICTGQGMMKMALPQAGIPSAEHGAPGHHDDNHDDKAADHPCAFAAASASVDLAALLHPAAAIGVTANTAPVDRLVPRPGLGLAAPPPPKTGPPLHN